jgi:homoserine O-succinyltransferase
MSEFAAHRPLVIGLVNNMPDAALKAAERQFRGLLKEAGGNVEIYLQHFFLPGVPRGEAGLLHLANSYSSIESIWDTPVDGLIVTGAMPCAPVFEDEPYWASFSHLCQWAEEQAVPVLWSCLAAHAAVRYIDGIARRRFDRKLSGVFECSRASDHALLNDLPSRWRVPHSRYNDLAEADLAPAGYQVLSRLGSGSPDIFMKKRNSLFVFAQGHLEYDRTTLAHEYRRDLSKFLTGECSIRPDIPEDYFDDATECALLAGNGTTLAAAGTPDLKCLNAFLDSGSPAPAWRPPAVRLFSNWVKILLEERSKRVTSKLFWATHAEQISSEIGWRVE